MTPAISPFSRQTIQNHQKEGFLMLQTQVLSFATVTTIIRKHIAKSLYGSMPALLTRLFHSYAQNDPIGFDPASVSRWVSGASPVRAAISRFYLAPDHQNLLANDVKGHLLPLMADAGMVALELYALISTAENISTSQRAKLAARFSTADDERTAAFIAEVVLCSLKLINS